MWFGKHLIMSFREHNCSKSATDTKEGSNVGNEDTPSFILCIYPRSGRWGSDSDCRFSSVPKLARRGSLITAVNRELHHISIEAR
jgi:hypothetical protein